MRCCPGIRPPHPRTAAHDSGEAPAWPSRRPQAPWPGRQRHGRLSSVRPPRPAPRLAHLPARRAAGACRYHARLGPAAEGTPTQTGISPREVRKTAHPRECPQRIGGGWLRATSPRRPMTASPARRSGRSPSQRSFPVDANSIRDGRWRSSPLLGGQIMATLAVTSAGLRRLLLSAAHERPIFRRLRRSSAAQPIRQFTR